MRSKLRCTAWVVVLIVRPHALDAGQTLNLRFEDGSTQMLLTPLDAGRDITIEVWSSITNVGGVNGSGTHEGLNFVHYSVLSERLVDGLSGSVDGDIVARQLVSPFGGSGTARPGALAELNGDGITDLGSLASENNTAFAKPDAQISTYDDDESFIGRPITGGFEFLVQRITFHVDGIPMAGPTGAGTRLGVVIPSWIQGAIKGSNWFQDSNKELHNGVNSGVYFAGTSVTFRVVPEPSGAVLLAAGMLLTSHALCRGRRKSEPRMRGSSPR